MIFIFKFIKNQKTKVNMTSKLNDVAVRWSSGYFQEKTIWKNINMIWQKNNILKNNLLPYRPIPLDYRHPQIILWLVGQYVLNNYIS